MISLFTAETLRLIARRMTRFFPLSLAALFVVGVGIAYVVITTDDSIDAGSLDFVEDVASGVEATGLLGPITLLLPIMAFVIGASYIGADIKTGMLEQVLTWEPRRLRLAGARVVALILVVAVIAMLLALFLIALLFALVVAIGGTTGGLTGEFWGNVAVIVGRTGLSTGLFAAFGFGVTLLISNSIGSIVGFVIYWFIGEGFLVPAFLPQLQPYLPVANADAFASGNDVERIDGSVFSGDFELVFSHTYLVAGLILAAWVAVSLASSGALFARRDIQ